jgi:hypothetical protein
MQTLNPRPLVARTLRYLRRYRRCFKPMSGQAREKFRRFNVCVIREAFEKCDLPYSRESLAAVDAAPRVPIS